MNSVEPKQTDFAAITQVIDCYFEGLFYGKTTLLDSIFDQDVWLKAPNIRRSKKQWLEDVANRKTPSELGYEFAFKVLAIDIIKDQAMVKIECPLFEHQYIDYLGLLKEKGQWLIVNKMYTDVAQYEE